MESKLLPNIFVIAAPSATGKTTLVERLIKEMGDKLVLGISVTTRPPRIGEVSGDHYYFYSDEEFEEKIKGKFFLEWAVVHGRKYGLSNDEAERLLKTGKNPVLILDIQGLKNIRDNLDKNKYNKIVDIFILPPSEDEIIRRMKKRGTVDEEEIKVRLETMRKEMACAEEFSHRIVNDDLDKAYGELLQIVKENV